jgi:hypothetical protein
MGNRREAETEITAPAWHVSLAATSCPLAEFAVLFLEFALRFRYGWGLSRSGHRF